MLHHHSPKIVAVAHQLAGVELCQTPSLAFAPQKVPEFLTPAFLFKHGVYDLHIAKVHEIFMCNSGDPLAVTKKNGLRYAFVAHNLRGLEYFIMVGLRKYYTLGIAFCFVSD